MIEGTPGLPYGDSQFSFSQFNKVETNMKNRRKEIQALLEKDEAIISLTVFPRYDWLLISNQLLTWLISYVIEDRSNAFFPFVTLETAAKTSPILSIRLTWPPAKSSRSSCQSRRSITGIRVSRPFRWTSMRGEAEKWSSTFRFSRIAKHRIHSSRNTYTFTRNRSKHPNRTTSMRWVK